VSSSCEGREQEPSFSDSDYKGVNTLSNFNLHWDELPNPSGDALIIYPRPHLNTETVQS